MLTQVQGSSTDEQKEKEKRKMAIVPKEKWILVEAPKSMEEDFEVVTMGEVKTAVNEFIVQCFTTDIPMNTMEFKNLDDRSLKEIIDKAVVNLKPEGTVTKLYRYGCEAYSYGKQAYKVYHYAIIALGVASNPIVMKIIAEYATDFSILAYSTTKGLMYWCTQL
uniref:Uncharacterized protein n=1 Tax=Lotharella globosa TaxID=91324 RepID=A0A7S3YWA2_9EUKA